MGLLNCVSPVELERALLVAQDGLLGPPPADDDRVALDGKQPLSGRGTQVVRAFDEDRSRVRTPDNLLNLAMFRRMAVTLTIA